VGVFWKNNKEENTINLTLIGREMVITGHVISEDNLRIEGKIFGNVETKRKVIIDSTGVVHGNITGGQIVVKGKVIGDIIATEECIVDTGGYLTGNIKANNVNFMTDAYFDGSCFVTGGVNQSQKVIKGEGLNSIVAQTPNPLINEGKENGKKQLALIKRVNDLIAEIKEDNPNKLADEVENGKQVKNRLAVNPESTKLRVNGEAQNEDADKNEKDSNHFSSTLSSFLNEKMKQIQST